MIPFKAKDFSELLQPGVIAEWAGHRAVTYHPGEWKRVDISPPDIIPLPSPAAVVCTYCGRLAPNAFKPCEGCGATKFTGSTSGYLVKGKFDYAFGWIDPYATSR